MDDVAIKAEHLSKTFKLPLEKHTSVKSAFVNFYRKQTYESQKALQDVSFEIKKGEFFGIVGRNGSGKSTLLKTIAGIYAPDKGEVKVNGTLVPFIELGVGFNPELTGRENVFLNGALLGFNRKEMSKMYDDIVKFAELEKFMDQKLKNYSSGMQVRLAFSIAIRAQGDILLLDEVLAVGDAAFQRKCMEYFHQLKQQNKTVILVTHDMGSVRDLCTRAALITNGKLDYVGSPEHVAELYEEQNASETRLSDKSASGTGLVGIEKISVVAPKSKKGKFGQDEKITVRLTIRAKESIKTKAGINIIREDGQFVAGVSSEFQIEPYILKPEQTYAYEFTFNCGQLTSGTFLIDGVLYDAVKGQPIYFKPSMARFSILSDEQGWGIFNLKGVWRDDSQKE